MSSHKIYFAKVFLVLAVIRNSVTYATITSSVIATSSVTSPQSISSNATTNTPSASSTPVAGGPVGNASTGGPTTPAQNVSTLFTIPWHLIYQFTNPPTSNTPPPTTIPTTADPCVFAKRPTDVDKCGNESCALNFLKDMELYISCGKSGSENYYKHPTSLPDMGEMLALKISNDIKDKLETNKLVNGTVVIVTDQLAIGASAIDSSMYTNISHGMMSFPNISIEGMKEKLGRRAANRILYPEKDISSQPGLVRVAWSISEAWKTNVPKDEIEPFRDIVWRLPVSDMKVEKNKILVNKEKPDLTINSPVITFSLEPKPQTPLVDPFLIEFKRIKSDGVRNHGCYFWSEEPASSGFWSSLGSSVVSNNDTHIVCSYNHMSTFVVLSEIHPERDDDARKAVRIVAIVFCILAMGALIATIRMTKKLECMDNDRVMIHIHLCVILIIGYFLFIIGAIKSDVKVLNDILVTGLHFCQLSPFVWLLLEAVYLINTIYPIFDYKNTDTQKFYISFGWALTAAFAGATAGYDFPHNGRPLASEIVWIFINKGSCGYYFGPFLAFFLINILIRVGLAVQVTIRPEQCNNEKVPLRIKMNLLTTAGLSAVVFLAWYLGVQAVNNTETKGYHYSFIMFYCFQAFLVFIIYGWQNEEMWSLHNKRKEEERQVEERKITFTYVP